MLELVDTTMFTLEVNKKEQTLLGQRIRAVDMCNFYKKGDLEKGNNYQLRRNSDNPKDTNCFEVRGQHIKMLLGKYIVYDVYSSRKKLFQLFRTINYGRTSKMIASVVFIPSLVPEDAKWSREDSGRQQELTKYAWCLTFMKWMPSE